MNTPKQLAAKLNKIPAAVTRSVRSEVLEVIAAETHGLMVQRIQRNSGNGRTYKRGSRTHVASAAGEYPNTDTGALVKSIYWKMVSKLTAHVGTPILYGKHLEFGTSTMAARPFMRPTWDDMKGRANELLKNAIKGVMNGR